MSLFLSGDMRCGAIRGGASLDDLLLVDVLDLGGLELLVAERVEAWPVAGLELER